MNRSTVGWTKDLLHFGRFWTGRDPIKSRKPILGGSGYFSMVNSGELPQGTHADRFDENRVYSITSYSKVNCSNPIDVFDRKRECNEDVEKILQRF
jgi:hypothetical protein